MTLEDKVHAFRLHLFRRAQELGDVSTACQELGFHDLRVPETLVAPADLAHQFGIEGLCYWHYWFAGKQLLQRPFSEVLSFFLRGPIILI